MFTTVHDPLVLTLKRRWLAACLATRFAITAAAVIATGMAVLGWWVSGRIEKGVVSHAAANASLHMDIFIEPQLQNLAKNQPLSEASKRALTGLGPVDGPDRKVLNVTVWDAFGMPIFSTTPQGYGAISARDTRLVRAARLGDVQSTYDTAAASLTASAEPAKTLAKQDRVLRVFSPMHETGTSRIIAVAELEEVSPQLAEGLKRARMQTTGVVGLLSLAMFASLFGIVRRGSRMIDDQRRTLEDRVHDLTALLKENAGLQAGIVDVNQRATQRNDKALRRIGAELHDGPVQLIALGLLRLESLKLPGLNSVDRRNDLDLDAIETALRDALKEIRDLCSGVALPNLEGVSVSKVIDYAIMNHARRSRTRVARTSVGDLNIPAHPLVLMCIYRFIQEALNNAFKHAGGQGQHVATEYDGERLRIEIADTGPGMAADALDPARFADGRGLGLAGLKDRVETLGGRFAIESGASEGTRISATLNLADAAATMPLESGSIIE